MPKNLSEVIEQFRSLAPRIPDLPDPSSYYEGRRHSAGGLPNNILLFGREEASTLVDKVRHFHHRNILIIPMAGGGRIVIDGKAHILEPGRCALIRAYQFHHYSHLSPKQLSWLFITFEDGDLRLKGTIFSPRMAVFWQDACELFLEYQTVSSDGEARLGYRLALILSLLKEVRRTREEPQGVSSSHEDLVLRVHEMIRDHMHRMLTIEEIARKVGLSSSHLRTRFRKAAGRSLGEFQREMRLQKAAELLTRKECSVGKVAEACGWESAFAFSRAFRRYWKRSPKKFSLFSQSKSASISKNRKK